MAGLPENECPVLANCHRAAYNIGKVSKTENESASLFTIRWHMTHIFFGAKKGHLHLHLNKLSTRCEMYVKLELTTIRPMSNVL